MRFIIGVLLWIDQSPLRYWVVASSVYALLIALCLLPVARIAADGQRHRFQRALGSDALFLAVAAMAIFAFRWPILAYPKDLNPDESCFIREALTLRHDPVFWRSVSSGTSGPLNIFPLLLPWLVGFPLNYPAARLVGLSCIVGAIAFYYFTCRRLAPLFLARLAVLPPLTFLALVTFAGLVHFSSEHVPLFLVTTAFCLALQLAESQRNPSRIAFAAGCILGAVPFTKVQSTLLALTITVFCYLFLLTRFRESARTRLRYCGWLTLGSLAVPMLLLSITAAGGAFEHFWQSYVLANLQYEHTTSLIKPQGMVPILKQNAQAFYPYLSAMLLLGVLGITAGAVRTGRNLGWNAHSRFLALATAVLIAAWVCVVTPARPWIHYLLFMVIPAATWAFAAIAFFVATVSRESRASVLVVISVIWCAVGVGWQVMAFRGIATRPLGMLAPSLDMPRSRVAQTILHYASPDEPLPVS